MRQYTDLMMEVWHCETMMSSSLVPRPKQPQRGLLPCEILEAIRAGVIWV